MGILSESMREKINERELKASGSTQKENSLSRSMREKINERELKASGSTQKENSLSRSILNEDDSLFDIAITEGAKRNSAQSTEIINLKNSTGLPEDVVERNFNEVTQKNRQKQIDTKKFSQSNPEVSRWMSQSPNHAAAGYEDLTGLSYLERQIKYIRNQFKQGNRTVELAEIGEAALLGKATQQQRKRQNKIEEEQAQASDYDITGTIEEVPGAIAQQLPIIKSTIKGQIKGAGTGAIVGAGLGSVVPGIGTISGGVTGASFGWRYGAGVQAARQEAGLAYLEYEKIIDSKGRKIDRDVAVGSALIVGVINGAFEMVGFESIIKTVPGLRALSRKQVKQVLKSQSVNSTLYNYAKNVGLAIGAEGATEFIQEFVTITGKETVKAIKENRKITTEDFLSRIFSDDNISQALQAARAGAQAGGGIALSAGAVSSTIDYRKAKAAKVKAQNIEKTGQTVESLKLHKTSPKSVEQIVDNIAESKDVYIPSDTFQTYWQEKGIDPKQVISEVLGNTDQFDNAVETGQDIVIPAAKYYTSPLLGAGENKSFFAQEVRTDPLEMNAREWQDEIKRLDEEAVKIDESSAIGKDFLQVEEAPKIREAMKTKLTKAGYDNRTADSNAQLYESTFQNLGDLAGIDPVQLFERFNPEISRLDKEQTKTFLDRIKEGAQNLFQTKDQFPDVSKKVAISTGLTETTEFKNWFGDSKVVDEQGKPLVVYHGTNSDFEGFDLSKSKMASKANPSDLGFWFVDDSTYASYHGNNVLETYVSLKNPKIYSSEEWNSINKKQDFKAIRESLIKQGHDGVITEESFDTLGKFNVRNPRLVVAFNPEQIKSVNNRGTFDSNDPRILFQDEVKKGAFRFGDGTFNIYLLEKADLSTFLHETGHFFLEMVGELAESSQASSEIKSYYKDVLEYLGVESRDQIATEHHEKFARGFEAYLMYGKAPSTALRRVFARFKVWLTNIYGTLKSLEVELTDDVRSVFDRLVASDKQIQEVEGEINISPLFEDTTILGNSAEKYKQAIEDFRMEVAERATSKMMKEYQREHKQWYKDELNNQREIVKQEMFADRAYIALTALQKGELPDGTPYSSETIPPKLSRKEVESIIGEERTKNLPRGIFAKDGAHPAILADLFQFRSDVALLEALESVEKPKDRIERVSKERMKELFPNLEDQQDKFREEILKDIHNEKRSEILRFELKWLAEEAPTILKDAIRKVSRRVPSNTDVKAYAKSVIDKSRVSKIEPNFYLRAEKAAARNAGISLAKGDLDEAFEQKRIELLNHELYKQAVEAKEQIRYSLDNFKKIAIADKKLSKNRDVDLVNAARAILAEYGIGDKGRKPESYLENMRLYDQETYNGIIGLVRSSIDNASDYRSITYGDFIDFNNTIQAIWDLSKSSKEIEIKGVKINRDEIVDELVSRLEEVTQKKEKVGYEKKSFIVDLLMSAKAATRRVESWANNIDDGNINGVFTKYIVTPVIEASAIYRDKRNEKLKEFLDIVKMVEPSLDNQPIIAKELYSKREPDGHIFKNKAELLGAISHIGNESNFFKLVAGYGWGALDENGVLDLSRWDSFLKRMWDEGVITKTDHDFIQAIWDLFESMKQDAQKAHKKIYGYYFNEITAKQFDTPFGKYRGGYMPAKIDPENSVEQIFRESKNELFDTQDFFTFPDTGSGWAKNRVEGYAEPLDLGVEKIPAHIDSVMKFIYINPTVKDVGKILLNRKFKERVHEFDNKLMLGMFIPWIKRVASQRSDTSKSTLGIRLLRALRRNIGMNFMFLNVTNALTQYTGVFLASSKVPTKYILRGAKQTMKHMFNPSALREEISKKSLFMKNLESTSAVEVQKTIEEIILNPNPYQKLRDKTQKYAYLLQTYTQGQVNNIAWIGAYNYSIEKGMTEKDAIISADAVVRQTQGTFNPEDLSSIEASSAPSRLFLMFANYFLMKANLTGTEVSKIVRGKGIIAGSPDLTILTIKLFLLPICSLIAIKMLLNGTFDDDDDNEILDDFANQFFFTTTEELTAMAPFVGPYIQNVINRFDNKFYNDRLNMSPIVSLGDNASVTVKEFADLFNSDEEVNQKALLRNSMTLLGGVTGIPLHAVGRTGGYLIDIDEGKAEPTGLIDFSRGLITGKSGN